MTLFLDQIIDAHRIRIRETGLEILTQIPDASLYVTTDRDALEQVVINFMDNVLKYAGTGSFIRFVLETEES